MRLEIPPEHVEALNALARMDDAKFTVLKELLNQTTPTAEPSKVIERIVESLSAEIPNPKELMGTVVEMVRTKQNVKGLGDDGQYIQSILAGMANGGDDPLTEDEKGIVSGRIASLIDSEGALARSYKAHSVLTRHQKVFGDARILTDIRPVFHEDLNIPLDEVVVVHTLDLAYYEDGSRKQVYVALDVNDLNALQKEIERAGKKNEAIQSRMAGFGVHFSNPEHGE